MSDIISNDFFGYNSGAVNGIGDFSEDFTNDEDVDARNKMFEEVKRG